ncbi:MAG: nitrous oxide-stimulated promoter family protein, partial [Phycisphaerales bacterium]
HHSGGGGGLCPDCAELAEFARFRLDKCPYGEDKPTCANCPVHCYQPHMRRRIQEVMRFSGPRMLLSHPILAIFHLLDGRRVAPDLPGASKKKRGGPDSGG